eukprot:TRINITY_DN1355_c0_g1::TRINITY_DN1355_c0_g1_i1::g.19970::m.19970 TRINITY_DN1355_c0_g1::TRINITY_DN1355_c0_g1_i1::g.19970  ORF type:complete len:206 (+),score=45.44 TRINITY_DN1355_c0_g1_i1:58-618(+)
METSINYSSKSCTFRVAANHSFEVTDNVRVLVSSSVAHGSDTLNPRAHVLYNKTLFKSTFPVNVSSGVTLDFDGKIAAASVGVKKTLPVPVLDNDYMATTLVVRGEAQQALKKDSTPAFVGRAAVKTEFYLGDTFIRAGVGADHQGNIRGAVKTDALTFTSDFKGGWDVGLSLQGEGSRELIPGWF